ncbi:hypothetical protein BCBBV1cgp31 [Bacillus phage BCASJ1c]|uniref:31 n=1 Tax=Bacillus phage BCASJ1c TaxID=294382 RepID=Q5YA79_9CAUD|nr:hypothetical protein BCBBV1cgp31 [Bacillus phage BCASJ1c]AAU85078.1 31 [Bacillus phage BCASJ1c]
MKKIIFILIGFIILTACSSADALSEFVEDFNRVAAGEELPELNAEDSERSSRETTCPGRIFTNHQAIMWMRNTKTEKIFQDTTWS